MALTFAYSVRPIGVLGRLGQYGGRASQQANSSTADGHPAALEPVDSYCIGKNYRIRPVPQYYADTPTNMVCQPDVYPEAQSVARIVGSKTIIDIGSGNGHKLVLAHPEFAIIGIDFGTNLDYVRTRHPQGTWIEHDLEEPGPLPLSAEQLDGAVIICSDVIEHLMHPEHLLAKLHLAFEAGAAAVLLSTPERVQTWGPDQSGPPPNLCHVREWTLPELGALLEREGFAFGDLGVTRSNTAIPDLATSLVVMYRDAEIQGMLQGNGANGSPSDIGIPKLTLLAGVTAPITPVLNPAQIPDSAKKEGTNTLAPLSVAFLSGYVGPLLHTRIPAVPQPGASFFASNVPSVRADAEASGWKVIAAPDHEPHTLTDELVSTNISKMFKLAPQEIIALVSQESFDHVVWFDNKYDVNVEGVLSCLRDMGPVPSAAAHFHRHPWLHNTMEELQEAMSQPRYRRELGRYMQYMSQQEKAGLSSASKIHFQGGFILYHLKHPDCIPLQETWRRHIDLCGIEDQISLSYVAQIFSHAISTFVYPIAARVN